MAMRVMLTATVRMMDGDDDDIVDDEDGVNYDC